MDVEIGGVVDFMWIYIRGMGIGGLGVGMGKVGLGIAAWIFG